MFGRIQASLLALLWTGLAHGQTVDMPSPLPIFDTESGIPFVAESIIAPETLQDVKDVDAVLYDFASIVARVETLTDRGFCTGFRVGEDLFMTNHHCWDGFECEVKFHLGYEEGLAEDDHVFYKCKEVLAHEESLDFALYRVEALGDVSVDYPIATLSAEPLTMDMPLLVPGHPAAVKKQIDISDQCRLTRVEPYDWYDRKNIQHQCDTKGGSSGSPVIDRANGHVVGIHWGATGGTGSNHAIPMNLIIDYLEKEVPEVMVDLTIVQ